MLFRPFMLSMNFLTKKRKFISFRKSLKHRSVMHWCSVWTSRWERDSLRASERAWFQRGVYFCAFVYAEDDTPDAVPSTTTASSVSAGGSSGPADSLPVVHNLFDWLLRHLLTLINLTPCTFCTLYSLELMTPYVLAIFESTLLFLALIK